MYGAFQSNAYQNNAFQILQSGTTPIPPDTHDGASPDDIRRWKKYLRELKEYQENKSRPKKRRKRKGKLPEIQFIAENFPTARTLEREIRAVMALIAAREEELRLIEQEDEEEAILLLL